jgi:hypothetical protein
LGKNSITLDELKEKYKTKGPELSLVFGYYRLELFLTNKFLDSNISANQVTTASFVLGIVGCLFLSTGQLFLLYLGTLFLIAWAFLDYIDGNIARAKKAVGKVGFFLDLINSHVIGIFSLVSMGIGISLLSIDQGQTMLSKIVPSSFILEPLIIALTGALAYAIKRFLKAYSLLILGENKTKAPTTNSTENNKPKKRTPIRKIGFLLRGLIEFPRSYTLIVLISLLLSKMYLWIYLVSLAFIVSSITESVPIIKRLYILTHGRTESQENLTVTTSLAD